MDTKKIRFSIYMVTVLISLYSAFKYGKNDMVATMLTAVVILGIGGYYINGKQENATFSQTKDIFAFMWIVLYLILPGGNRPSLGNIEPMLSWLMYAIRYPENTLFIYYTGALALLLIFGKRWKTTLAYRAGLYIIVSLIVVPFFESTYASYSVDMDFCYYMTIFTFLCEYISIKRFEYRPLLKKMLLFFLTLFVILMLYPDYELVMRMHNLFYIKDSWPYVMIILMICGVSCVLENHNDIRKLMESKMSEVFVTGCALICMAIYIFLGKAWPQFFNIIIVYIAAPAVILLTEYFDGRVLTGKVKFLVWIGSIFCLAAAGKTLNENYRYYFVIIAILIVRFILLKLFSKNDGETIIMRDFWGIAATLLLFSARHDIFNMNMIRTLTLSFVVLAGSCVLWVLLTHSTYAFDKQLKEGRYPKNDYEMIPLLQKAGFCLIMMWTLFSLLF